MINKLQTGGQVYFSAVPTANLDQTQSTPQTSNSSSKKKPQLISEDLLEELYTKGIPVDVDLFSDQLANFEARIDSGLPVNKKQLYNFMAKANRIIQQSKYLESAEKRATTNEAIGDVAVGNIRGGTQLFVLDNDNKVQAVDIHNYDIERHGPALTINELIEHRKFNHTQAFDSTLTQIIGSNIGTQKINEHIKDIISIIGTSSTATEAYSDLASLFGQGVVKPTQAEFNAVQRLAQEYEQLGPDEIFKLSELSSSKNIKEGFNYIMRALPKSEQLQLIGRNVAVGNSVADSQKEVADLIISALNTNNNIKFEQRVNFTQNTDNISGKSGSSKSSKTYYQTPNEAFFDGDLNRITVRLTDNAFGNKSYIDLKGVQMPSLTNDKGEALSNVPLGIALSSSLLKYTNKSKIYMGEQKVTEGFLNNIAYSGDQVAAVYMPVTDNGDIDWDSFHAFSQAEQYISEQGITDIDQKNAIHSQFGSFALFDKNGELIQTRNTSRYLLTYGYTIDDLIDERNNKMVEELYNDEEKYADKLINEIYNKKLKQNTGISKIDHKNIWDDIYKVPVFIKIDDKASGDAYRYGGHGSSMIPKTLQEDMLTDLSNQQPTVRVTGNTDLLYADETKTE